MVTRGDRTKIISAIHSADAALLDSRMTEKCCGSRVPVSSTTSVSNGRLTSLLPGFRTRENYDPEFLLPSRIGAISVILYYHQMQ